MRRVLALTLLLLTLAGCGGAGPTTRLDPPATELDPRLTSAGVQFGIDLLKRVYTGTNTFLSPASASLILSLTANGAKGETQAGMLKALRADALGLDQLNQANAALQTVLANPDPKVELAMANAVWYAEGLKLAPAFETAASEHYQAELKKGLSVPAINGWVKERTRDRIPELLDQASPLTVMVLVNALYFKGEWADPFEESSTVPMPFTKVDGSTKQVPFMQQRSSYGYIETDGVRGIRLPYGGGRLALYAIMPDRWDGFLDSLSADRWNGWISEVNQQQVALALPKVKLETAMELKEPLIAMGMGDAFDPAKADFTGLFTRIDDPVYIGRVVQKTFLEIGERGTEAAAATAVVVETAAAPVQGPVVLELNRPFLVAIRDDTTGALLFLGLIMEP